MYSKIYLRHDQCVNDLDNPLYKDKKVMIVAPEWVKPLLAEFNKYFTKESIFTIRDTNGTQKLHAIKNEMNLKELIMIARNEPLNTNGVIKFTYYRPLITDRAVIYSLKDLARQCVIVGMDETTHFGGFHSKRIKQTKNVIVVDLIGLQFQNSYNSGRLVLIGEELPKGLFDDMIYKNIVGEKKKCYKEVTEDHSDRYIKHENIYFDTYAYEKFVAHDVYLSGLAINISFINEYFKSKDLTKKSVNFKFLKYGTGFYAGVYRDILVKHIDNGIIDGFQKLFGSQANQCIKSVELPFYGENRDIAMVCAKYNIECIFSADDALKKSDNHYMTATTNCADAHVVTGNAMGFSSVDASIASNLITKANKFSPVFNPLMTEIYLPNFKQESVLAAKRSISVPEDQVNSTQGHGPPVPIRRTISHSPASVSGIPSPKIIGQGLKLKKEDISEPKTLTSEERIVYIYKDVVNELKTENDIISDDVVKLFKN